MTGFRPALSLRGAKRRGPQGSAASGLRATAASAGGKGAKKLGSHLVLRKQRAAQTLSGNPEGAQRPQRLGRRLRLRKQRAAQMLSANPEIRIPKAASF